MTWREKETVKGDWCEPAKDPQTIKLVFSLEHKGGELVNSRTYLGRRRLDPFIESQEWVYLFGSTIIMGDV